MTKRPAPMKEFLDSILLGGDLENARRRIGQVEQKAEVEGNKAAQIRKILEESSDLDEARKRLIKAGLYKE